MAGQGYYGAAYDRHVPNSNDQSTIYKMKETYWTTKQAVMKKLGKKEDEHIVASDSELDAKLEVFKAIQKSSMDLLRVIERYQDRICVLSREENAMGRLLKAESQHDKTRAGKMMAAVGKAQSFSSQQMLQLRSPLVRLYQEVETFRYRAISDTLVTVNRMEAARTEYRGTLLWMKDVSEELDPDTSKQLQKFRTVQAQVKKTKAKFDKLKLDTMQKIDLLAASRCNMFSHVLAKYQSTLLHFWERTAYRMTAVAESFKGYQYYEFNMLKELGEPSKKLAEETGSREAPEHDIDDAQDELSDLEPSKKFKNEPLKTSSSDEEIKKNVVEQEKREKILDFPIAAESKAHSNSQPGKITPKKMVAGDLLSGSPPSHERDLLGPPPSFFSQNVAPQDLLSGSPPKDESMLHQRLPTGVLPNIPYIPKAAGTLASSGGNDNRVAKSHPNKSVLSKQSSSSKENTVKKLQGSLNNLLETADREMSGTGESKGDGTAPFIDFGDDEEVDLEEIKRKQDEEFDFTGMLKQTSASKKQKQTSEKGTMDLLSEDFDVDDTEKDDLTLLNEILNAPATGGDDFSREWHAVFGSTPLSASTNLTPVESDNASEFMPSCLLDMTSGMGSMSLGQPGNQGMAGAPAAAKGQGQVPAASQKRVPTGPQPKKKDNKQEMSAWFNLFAELDPLANPDAIGRKKEDLTDA